MSPVARFATRLVAVCLLLLASAYGEDSPVSAPNPAPVVQTESMPQDAPTANAVEQTPDVSLSGEYARLDANGAIIAGKSEWYLEEPDSIGRPSTGIVWKNDGSVARKISWLYYGDTVQAEAKVESSAASTTETRYDRNGNVTLVSVTGPDGAAISTTENEYGKSGKLSVSTFTQAGTSTRNEYSYAKDGVISRRTTFVDGVLTLERFYKDENSWTEKVYKQGKAVLVLTYDNGIRQDKK